MKQEEIKRVVKLFVDTEPQDNENYLERLVEFAFKADGKIPHTHFAGIQDIDECRICGLDIRNRVHSQFAK